MGICEQPSQNKRNNHEPQNKMNGEKIQNLPIITKFYNKIRKCICEFNYNYNSQNVYQEHDEKYYISRNLIGFLCEIPFPNNSNLLPVLITSNHILGEENIQIGKEIKFNLNDKPYKIKIDNSRKTFMDVNNNIIIIEIKKEDNIKQFLKIDDDISNINQNQDQLFMVEYECKENEIESIKILNNMVNLNKDINFLFYSCDSEINPLGGLIFNSSTNTIFGMHKNKDSESSVNIGIPIKQIIIDFYKNNSKNKNEEKSVSSKKQEEKKDRNPNSSKDNENIINNNESKKEDKNRTNISSEITNINNNNGNIDEGNKGNTICSKKTENSINNKAKEINLIFHIIDKELFLDAKESMIFNEVIRQLKEKYIWLESMNINNYQYNGININNEKSVKENDLKDNADIIIIENK